MRYLSLPEVLELHKAIISISGGAIDVRDFNGLESALMQPHLTFNRKELYPDVASKAASLCFSLVMNHPFIDGNKRTGHAAMELFLIFNGFEINASVDEQENIMLNLAAGKIDRIKFTSWLKTHIINLSK